MGAEVDAAVAAGSGVTFGNNSSSRTAAGKRGNKGHNASEIVQGAAVHVLIDDEAPRGGSGAGAAANAAGAAAALVARSPIAKNELALVELVEEDPACVLVRSVRGGQLWWYRPEDLRPITTIARKRACRSSSAAAVAAGGAGAVAVHGGGGGQRSGQLESHCRGIALDLSYHQDRLLTCNFRILQPPGYRNKRGRGCGHERGRARGRVQPHLHRRQAKGAAGDGEDDVVVDERSSLQQLQDLRHRAAGLGACGGHSSAVAAVAGSAASASSATATAAAAVAATAAAPRLWQELCSATATIASDYFCPDAAAHRKVLWHQEQDRRRLRKGAASKAKSGRQTTGSRNGGGGGGGAGAGATTPAASAAAAGAATPSPNTSDGSNPAPGAGASFVADPPYEFARTCLFWIAWLLRPDHTAGPLAHGASEVFPWRQVCGAKSTPPLQSLRAVLSLHPDMYLTIADDAVHSWLRFTGRHRQRPSAGTSPAAAAATASAAAAASAAGGGGAQSPSTPSQQTQQGGNVLIVPARYPSGRLFPGHHFEFRPGQRIAYHFRDHPGIWCDGLSC